MGKRESKQRIILDSRALRKAAEHGTRNNDALEESPEIQQQTVHASAREDQLQHNNKERRKSKKPKAQRQNQEEVCCTITTVPSISSSSSLEQSTTTKEEESKKLNCATNDTTSQSSKTKCKSKTEVSMKDNSTAHQKSPPSQTSEVASVSVGEEKPIVSNKNVPFAPIADRKRVKDFLRRNKYKRPSLPNEGATDIPPDIELLLKANRSNSASYQEATDEMKEICEKLTSQVKRLEADMKTELRRSSQEDYDIAKEIRANLWYETNFVECLYQVSKVSSTKDGHLPINTVAACNDLQSMYRVLRAIVAKCVDKQLQTNHCNDGYANMLGVLRTQESIIDCHVNSTCAKHVGKNVLKNQIKILSCVYQYLLTKGLWVFSKRESTPLKTWRQIIQTYDSKQQQFTKTIEQMTSAIQKQRQMRERDHEELLKSFQVEHKPLLKKFKVSFDDYKARVLQSKQYKMLKDKHAGVRRSIGQRGTEISYMKQVLEDSHRELAEERSKPKTYQSLFAEWGRIKAELQSQSGKLKDDQVAKEELRVKIRENNGHIHQLQLCEQDLKAELDRVDAKKKALNACHEDVMRDRKKLQIKQRQYPPQQNFTLF